MKRDKGCVSSAFKPNVTVYVRTCALSSQEKGGVCNEQGAGEGKKMTAKLYKAHHAAFCTFHTVEQQQRGRATAARLEL